MRKPILLSLAALSGQFLTAQNTCPSALPIGEGSYQVTAIDGQVSPVNCLGGNPTLAEWYTFTSPVDTGVIVTTEVVGFPLVDTRIQVFSGTCGALVCHASDDDGGNGLSSLVQFYAAANVTYIIEFDNRWSSSGFHFTLSLFPPPPPPVDLIQFSPVSIPGMGYNMAAVDMNNDQLDDMLSPSASSVRIGYQQPDGTFNFVTIATETATHTASWSMCVGDLDKNGANDLMYGSGSGVSLMFSNEEGTSFSATNYPNYVFCQRTNMVDLDNDGNLDAFSCHDVDANVAFMNNGVDSLIFEQGGYGETCGNYGSVFTDYNNDGLVDLFVAKCGCDPEDLLMPNSPGGIFTDVAPELGLNDTHQSWSSAWGDFDNDGDMDVMIGSSSSSVHKLMRNNGDGTFTNITNEAGANANNGQSIEWTTHDFNNDGWLDILGGAGLLVNDGDGTFTMDVSAPDNGPVGDMNNDGYLDVINSGLININQSAGNNWLRVQPVGSVSNSNGIGARIVVTTDGLQQIRDVKSGDGFRYMSSLMAHFGLAQAQTATVEVRWPSGIVDHIQDVTANQVLVVYEGLSTASVFEAVTPEIAVHPVPARDRITISGAETNNRPARIYSTTGALVRSATIRANTIGIEDLSQGVYILEVTTTDGALRTRFVKD
ncbi:MAG: VCBS repeat-containing protein [Flavobacteriales bacterium]|nr:VCBS repeat-containing protein [Flavobacteriales bacterium]